MAEGIFLRKATGLVREVGLGSAILFCTTYTTVMWGPFLVIPYFAGYGNFVGNVWLGLAIGLVATLLVNSVYAHFSSAMPRSGGDYVFIGRTINPLLGFAANWGWSWVATFWNAANLLFFATIMQLFLSGFYSQDALAFWYSTWGTIALGLILWIIAFVLLIIGGTRAYMRFQSVAWIIMFAAFGVVAYYFMSAAGNFPALFNSWAQQYVPTEPDMYHKIINDAVAGGFQLNPPPEGPMMPQTLAWAVMTLGVPYTAGIVWIAGEVKKAESGIRQHIAMEIGEVFYTIILIVAGVTFLFAADPKFLGALLYLGSVNGLPVTSFFWSLFPAIMPPWAFEFFAFAALLGGVIVYCAGVLVVSRCLFAWSFDRLLPSFFAHVSDRNKVPTTALATALIFTLFLLVLEVNANIWTYIGASYFMVMISIFIVCFAGLVFPYVRKDMFEQMPLKARIGGIPVLSIVSLLSLVFMVWTGTSYFTNPAYMTSFGITQTMIVCTVLIYAVGIAIYFISRAYNKRRGIDLAMAFRQIPPA